MVETNSPAAMCRNLLHRTLIVFFVFSIIPIHANLQKLSGNLITKLFAGDKKPIILYMGHGHQHNDHQHGYHQHNDDASSNDEDETVDGNGSSWVDYTLKAKTKWLDYLLRSGENQPKNQTLADQILELETQQALRQALSLRCRKRDNCEQKCPPKKFTCKITCQEVFDDGDVCNPKPEPEKNCNSEDPCKPKRWGKTMPPYWLLK